MLFFIATALAISTKPEADAHKAIVRSSGELEKEQSTSDQELGKEKEQSTSDQADELSPLHPLRAKYGMEHAKVNTQFPIRGQWQKGMEKQTYRNSFSDSLSAVAGQASLGTNIFPVQQDAGSDKLRADMKVASKALARSVLSLPAGHSLNGLKAGPFELRELGEESIGEVRGCIYRSIVLAEPSDLMRAKYYNNRGPVTSYIGTSADKKAVGIYFTDTVAKQTQLVAIAGVHSLGSTGSAEIGLIYTDALFQKTGLTEPLRAALIHFMVASETADVELDATANAQGKDRGKPAGFKAGFYGRWGFQFSDDEEWVWGLRKMHATVAEMQAAMKLDAEKWA